MKKIQPIIISIVLISYTSCAPKQDKSPIEIEVKITSKHKIIAHNGDSLTIYPFLISVNNLSDSAFFFNVMSCSFKNDIIFNSKFIRVFPWGCDKNIPLEIQLHSNDKYTLRGGEFEVLNIDSIKNDMNLKIGIALNCGFKDSNIKVDTFWCEEPIKNEW